MSKYFISTISIPIILLLLVLCTTNQDITIGSKIFAQLPAPNVKSNISRIISTVANNNNINQSYNKFNTG
jgi:ABC-type bacteriocin/lantibiotic exporter with double-glycine peptidase domain